MKVRARLTSVWSLISADLWNAHIAGRKIAVQLRELKKGSDPGIEVRDNVGVQGMRAALEEELTFNESVRGNARALVPSLSIGVAIALAATAVSRGGFSVESTTNCESPLLDGLFMLGSFSIALSVIYLIVSWWFVLKATETMVVYRYGIDSEEPELAVLARAIKANRLTGVRVSNNESVARSALRASIVLLVVAIISNWPAALVSWF